VFYHNSKLPGGGEFRRSVAVEELHYNPDGTIRHVPQTARELLLTEELARLRTRDAVVDTRVAGLLGGVTLVDEVSAEAVTDALIDWGFITRPLRGNTVQISPPFITTADEIRRLVAAIDAVATAQYAA
jgi:adenosylmethionine-8-amino-7-oxononanoate aminotransferase